MKTREEIIKLIPKGSICAELGVFNGDFSKFIYNNANPSRLYLVDIFRGTVDSGDKNGDNVRKISLDKSYDDLSKHFKSDKSVVLYKGKSVDFLKGLPDETLDFIYIDADHSYAAVASDLSWARTKVKKNGIIAGHDYCPRFSGVMKALDEFVNKFNLVPKFTSSDKIPSFYLINSYENPLLHSSYS